MAANVLRGRKGGAPGKRPHPIKRRLRAMGKSITWLAAQMRVTPQTISNHMSGRHFMNPINFQTMLRVLEMDLNEYYEVGKYAGRGQETLRLITNNSKPGRV